MSHFLYNWLYVFEVVQYFFSYPLFTVDNFYLNMYKDLKPNIKQRTCIKVKTGTHNFGSVWGCDTEVMVQSLKNLAVVDCEWF